MQITHDKCTAGINCSDPDYNIRTGAKYFKDRLDANGGNLLLALGQYNVSTTHTHSSTEYFPTFLRRAGTKA